jgi:hypothetical protein
VFVVLQCVRWTNGFGSGEVMDEEVWTASDPVSAAPAIELRCVLQAYGDDTTMLV